MATTIRNGFARAVRFERMAMRVNGEYNVKSAFDRYELNVICRVRALELLGAFDPLSLDCIKARIRLGKGKGLKPYRKALSECVLERVKVPPVIGYKEWTADKFFDVLPWLTFYVVGYPWPISTFSAN